TGLIARGSRAIHSAATRPSGPSAFSTLGLTSPIISSIERMAAVCGVLPTLNEKHTCTGLVARISATSFSATVFLACGASSLEPVEGHRPRSGALDFGRRGRDCGARRGRGRGGDGKKAFRQGCCAGSDYAVGFRHHALSTKREGNEGREIMHRPVRFADDIEPLVQFIEETDPS